MTIGQFTRQCSGRYGAGQWHQHPTEPVSVRYVAPGHWQSHNQHHTAHGPTMARAVENLAGQIKEQLR